MKKFFGFSFVISLVILSTLQVSVTSCKKTVTIRDTVEIINLDTVLIEARDTVFSMDANSWNGFSFATNAAVAPGATTYTNTADGLKLMYQAYRSGLRVATKNEISIQDKTLYFKWKASGAGDFAGYALQLKYDPTTEDSEPEIQNIDLGRFCSKQTFGDFKLITDGTWYYTRVKPVAGTDKYQSITATGNYDNNGGTVFESRDVYVYTKHGYLGFRTGDTYNANAYLLVAEVRIASN